MEIFDYLVLAYYSVSPVKNPFEEIFFHKSFLKDKDASCRIYISEQGLNGQFSALKSHAEEYMRWLSSRPDFSNIKFKIHYAKENVFPRKTIKYKKQLVALDVPIDMSLKGEHIPPALWKELLLKKEALVLDVRNSYETLIGHFENAILPPLETFREFPAYADSLANSEDLKRPIMMYCTGGIRCEFYSSLLKSKGFETIYQLDGGVIEYGLQEGTFLWKGKLFVFDDRLAVPISDNYPLENPISFCLHCDIASDAYYNCANPSCNKLFLCCDSCVEKNQSCCSSSCLHHPKKRLFDKTRGNKPFKRKHLCVYDSSLKT